MYHCTEGHPVADGDDTCVHLHHVMIGAMPLHDENTDSAEATSSEEAPPTESSYVVDVDSTTEYEGDSMGDNYSAPNNQSNFPFGSFGGGFHHWKDRDGLEGKDAVLIHALHDGRDHKDTMGHVLDSKFDVVRAIDDRIDRLRDRVEDKFDKLDCKVERKFERIDDKLEEFERRQVARVIKEQDDKIQELKLKLLLCEKLPVPAPAPVPAP